MNRDLAGLRFEGEALDTDNIADIEALEVGITLISEIIAGDIDLDIAVPVENIAEGRLAHNALVHHAAGNTDRHGFLRVIPVRIHLAAELVKMLFDLGAVMGLVERCNLKRIPARRLQCRELLPAHLHKLALINRFIRRILFLCHDFFPFPGFLHTRPAGGPA